jgi:hypothetical protein
VRAGRSRGKRLRTRRCLASSDEECCSEGDLDGVLAGDPEQDLMPALAEAATELRGDVGFREIPEGVDAPLGLVGHRRGHHRVPVTQSGDAEAAREVEVFAAVRVHDPAALRRRPDHGRNRLSVSSAT